jgi:hypothetical protein
MKILTKKTWKLIKIFNWELKKILRIKNWYWKFLLKTLKKKLKQKGVFKTIVDLYYGLEQWNNNFILLTKKHMAGY